MASKIIVLDEKVANQIAAGEVIERPASILKELVENSIDAGSTRIQVEVQEGGRNSIRVLDNGEGISREDVLTAFERHATSKIREASDLFSIRTLGFRGEALPSIAAVSRVTLQTRTVDDPVGTCLKIEGGEVKDRREVGMAIGTDFLVEDLFFNTPARLKYMKTTSTEMAQISDIFNSIAIAEPQIAMSLAHNGRLISRTPGTGRLKDVIYTIYGRELVESLLEIEHEDNYIKVTGYVSRPTVYRSSRKHQSFYVNGRYVRSMQLSRAVSDAYANLLPDNRHAVVFLFVKINPVHVDVNVHPAKFEVKFSRPEMVADVVTRGIRQALIRENMLPTFQPIEKVWNTPRSTDEVELTSLFPSHEVGIPADSICSETEDLRNFRTQCREFATNEVEFQQDGAPGAQSVEDQDMISGQALDDYPVPHRQANAGEEQSLQCEGELRNHPVEHAAPESGEENDNTPPHRKVLYEQDPSYSAGRVAERLAKLDYQPKNWDPLHREYDNDRRSSGKDQYAKATPSKHTSSTSDLQSAEDQQPMEQQPTAEPQGPGAFIAGLLPIGQIHQTYIIAQGKDGFYVIDQHVAHERVLYEELMETFRTKGLPSQTLLIPLTLELTFKEIQIIQENEGLFNQIGFAVEHFGGNTIMLRAVPKRIDERPDKDLFLEIIDLLLEEKKVGDRAQLYSKLITSMSCKGAIKAGERLEQGEMIRLLQNLSKTQNPRFCPHGRPILFHISEKDLLKAFQRI